MDDFLTLNSMNKAYNLEHASWFQRLSEEHKKDCKSDILEIIEQPHKEFEYKLKEEAHLATMTDNLQRELALNWCIELLESNNTNNE